MKQKHLIIIGGGAAGFFCAANASHPNLRVTILEKTNKLLSKVKVSGGGRCNVTNGNYGHIQDFAAAYPRGKNLLKKTLYQFSFQDTVKWFESRGVALKTEADGRIFPESDSSQSIIDCLMNTCEQNQVAIHTGTQVLSIEQEGDRYTLYTNSGIFHADFICLATGGYPKEEQYKWIQDFGLKIESPVPSLFTFNLPGHPITQLMGVSVPHAQIKVQGEKLNASGPLLVTHWGLSGPCVLRLSAWGARLLADKKWNFKILINWLGDTLEEELRGDFPSFKSYQGNKILQHKNPFGLPARLWEFLIEDSGIDPRQHWSTLSSRNQNKLIAQLTQYECLVQGKTTFKEEFVTAGGIQLSSVQAQTMQYRNFTGLFILGEALDVDGITGGFNFQNAWTSAYIAAVQIVSMV